MNEYIKVGEQAARKAGEILLKMQSKVHIREKGPADLVTEADLAAQKAIFETISGHFSEHQFLGEEDVKSRSQPCDSEYCWIVDPLDGTTNYVHGLENFSVSIGLRHQQRIVAGVVYDPCRNVMYSAALNKGAYQDGKRISTSGISDLEKALIAASFSPKVNKSSDEIKRFVEVLCKCQALRRLGSAALNLCFVATGQLDAYWATSLKIWDLAAGSLIAKEAGATMTSLQGGEFTLTTREFAVSASRELQDSLLKTLTDAIA